MFVLCEHVYALQATLRSGLDKKWYMFYMLYDGLSTVPTSMNDDAAILLGGLNLVCCLPPLWMAGIQLKGM